jgi:simple sugar transport system ATP-binding protein
MPTIELRNIVKRFGEVTAVDGVSLTLAPGSVHGVLGENGAGKTTLMNILYGMVRPDGGEVRIDGHEVEIRSPRDAIKHGIGMVHQHFMLARAMTVLDNVLLGDRRAGMFLNRAAAAQRLIELAKGLNLELDPHERIEDLSVGQQQRVEILKALWRDASLLILDEPTAVLTPLEAEQLFAAVRLLRKVGKSIVFISHKLREVLAICDRLTVLRAGSVAWEGAAKGATESQLASIMIGEKMEDSTISLAPVPSDDDAVTRLRIRDLTAPGLTAINLDIKSEIVGIAGVDGNGQQELAEALIGLRKLTAGQILFEEKDITQLDAPNRFDLGLAHIPNDRKREGLVPSMSITHNLILKQHRRRPFSRMGLMHWRRIRDRAGYLAGTFDIRARSINSPISTLSGGNQQKVVLARELGLAQPKLIIAMNPTRGLDIAATRFVHDQLLAHRSRGAGILLISSELDEVVKLSDRIAVLYRGKLTMTRFPADGVDKIARLMTGLES